MPDFSFTPPPPPNIQFITGNPAIDAYNRAKKLAIEEQEAEAKAEHLKQATKQSQQEEPTRLRYLSAEADKAQTEAQTGKATAPYAAPAAQTKLRQMTAEASQAETGAETAKATAPYAASTAQTKLRALQAEADTAQTGAETAKATAPYAAPSAQAQLQQHQAETAQIENTVKIAKMKLYEQQIQMAEAGDVDGAIAAGQQAGIEGIHPEVLRNAQARGIAKDTIAAAKERNPGKPAEQWTFIQATKKTLQLQNQPAMAPYADVPGAPPPSQIGGQNATVPNEKHAQLMTFLQQQQIAKTPQEALAITQQIYSNPQHAAATLYTELIKMGKEPKEAQDIVQTAMKFIQSQYGGLQPNSGGGQAAPPAAVDALRAQPKLLADQFDAKYGAGSAAKILQSQATAPAQQPQQPQPAYMPGQQPQQPQPEIPL